MNKKILIAIGVVIVLIVVVKCATGGGGGDTGDVWDNNEVIASYPQNTIKENAQEPDSSRIYLEVSGSMSGYYNGDASNMVNILSRIKNLDDNTEVYFYGEKLEKSDAAYINDAIVGQAAKGKGAKTSTFHDKFARMIDTINKTGEIIYLVTDGIQSLNKRGMNMNAYLEELQGQIKSAFKNQEDIAVAVFRFKADFKGTYTTMYEKSVSHTGKRPFYVIALGKKANIRWLNRQNIKAEKSLFVGIHDFDGHDKAKLRGNTIPLANSTNDTLILNLQLPECLKGIKKEQIKIYTAGGTKEITQKTIDLKNPAEIKVTIKEHNVVDNKVTMVGIIDTTEFDNWYNKWDCFDDTKPDTVTTFGLKALIKGIVEGVQPGTELFRVEYEYK